MDFTSVFSGKFQVNGLARAPGQVGVSLALQKAELRNFCRQSAITLLASRLEPDVRLL